MQPLRIRATAYAVIALLGAAGAAHAQSPEAQGLGAQVVHQMFARIDVKSLLASQMKTASQGFAVKSRPEWTLLLQTAVAESLEADWPAVERVIGRAFAREFTLAELEAGQKILADPAIQQMIGAAAAGQSPGTLQPSTEVQRIASQGAGASFFRKLTNFQGLMAPLEGDIAGAVLPGMLRRMAEKIETSERNRAGR